MPQTKPSVSVENVVASRKLVCTEAKKKSDVYHSVHNLHDLLEEKELMIYDQ